MTYSLYPPTFFMYKRKDSFQIKAMMEKEYYAWICEIKSLYDHNRPSKSLVYLTTLPRGDGTVTLNTTPELSLLAFSWKIS